MRRRGCLLALAGGAGAALLPWCFAGASEGVYQELWDLDQDGSGVPALRVGARGDPERGWVLVDETGGGPDHQIFPEVVIPPAKRRTYELCAALFDNYRLDQRRYEDTTEAEAREMLALLEAVAATPVMARARAVVEANAGHRFEGDGWLAFLFDVWFRPFDLGDNVDLSGFEHVVVGEQKQAAVGGQHFWYTYHLADGAGPFGDTVSFLGLRYDGRVRDLGRERPDEVTLSYRWDAWDAAGGAFRPLTQQIGGFFVGCSIEGLVALGTVRFAGGPRTSVVNGARYDLRLYRSDDGRSMRTFFPALLG